MGGQGVGCCVAEFGAFYQDRVAGLRRFSAGDVMFPIVAQTVIYTVLAAAAALIDFAAKTCELEQV